MKALCFVSLIWVFKVRIDRKGCQFKHLIVSPLEILSILCCFGEPFIPLLHVFIEETRRGGDR